MKFEGVEGFKKVYRVTLRLRSGTVLTFICLMKLEPPSASLRALNHLESFKHFKHFPSASLWDQHLPERFKHYKPFKLFKHYKHFPRMALRQSQSPESPPGYLEPDRRHSSLDPGSGSNSASLPR